MTPKNTDITPEYSNVHKKLMIFLMSRLKLDRNIQKLKVSISKLKIDELDEPKS